MGVNLGEINIKTREAMIQEDFQSGDERRNSPPLVEGLVLAAFAFASSLFIGFELVFRYKYVLIDAMSRALSGMYTTLGSSFHLAAVGFVWNPLPSLLSIPFALVRGLWPPLMVDGFSSNIISALFSGIGAYYLNRLFYRFGISPVARILFTIVFILNPLMLLFGGNGMSDGMMSDVVIAALESLFAYFQTRYLSFLITAGIWLAIGFMIRYESVPIAGLLGIGVFIALYRKSKNWGYAEGSMIALLFPIVMAGLVWMILNEMIMKNPLYFADSPYSNAAQTSTGAYNTPWIVADRHHLLTSAEQVGVFTANFWPYVPAFVFLVVQQFRKKQGDLFGLPLIMASMGAPILQTFLLYVHRSAEWQRFFIYYIPFGFIMVTYILFVTNTVRKSFALFSVLVLLIAGDFGTWLSMNNPVLGHGNTGIIRIIEKGGIDGRMASVVQEGKQVAQYLNAHPEITAIISTFQTYSVVPFLKDPSKDVLTVDSNYKSVLENPRGRVNAILVAAPTALNRQTLMQSSYPTLWSGGITWTHLIKNFGWAKLYAILPDAP